MESILRDVMAEAATAFGWSPTELDRYESEYRRFLHLVDRYPTERLVPSRLVDDLWHLHLAHPDYASSFPGRVPEHTVHTRDGRDDDFARTLDLYRAEYGPPGAAWAHAADCWPRPGPVPIEPDEPDPGPGPHPTRHRLT